VTTPSMAARTAVGSATVANPQSNASGPVTGGAWTHRVKPARIIEPSLVVLDDPQGLI
jgi:hypothetical protein